MSEGEHLSLNYADMRVCGGGRGWTFANDTCDASQLVEYRDFGNDAREHFGECGGDGSERPVRMAATVPVSGLFVNLLTEQTRHTNAVTLLRDGEGDGTQHTRMCVK